MLIQAFSNEFCIYVFFCTAFINKICSDSYKKHINGLKLKYICCIHYTLCINLYVQMIYSIIHLHQSEFNNMCVLVGCHRNNVADGDIDVAATEFHRRFHISSDETEGQGTQVSTHGDYQAFAISVQFPHLVPHF